MSIAKNNVLYELGKHWVRRADRFKGFEVLRVEFTHSVVRASIGFEGQAGLERAIAECKRREELES